MRTLAQQNGIPGSRYFCRSSGKRRPSNTREKPTAMYHTRAGLRRKAADNVESTTCVLRCMCRCRRLHQSAAYELLVASSPQQCIPLYIQETHCFDSILDGHVHTFYPAPHRDSRAGMGLDRCGRREMRDRDWVGKVIPAGSHNGVVDV